MSTASRMHRYSPVDDESSGAGPSESTCGLTDSSKNAVFEAVAMNIAIRSVDEQPGLRERVIIPGLKVETAMAIVATD
jgi:hypothetical protein